jgi:hypothetical protein
VPAIVRARFVAGSGTGRDMLHRYTIKGHHESPELL